MKRSSLFSLVVFSLVSLVIAGCDSPRVENNTEWYHLPYTTSTLEQGIEDVVYDGKGNFLSYSYYGYRLQVSHLEFCGDSIRVFMTYSVWGSDDFVIKILQNWDLINQWHIKEGNNTGIIDFFIMSNMGLVFEIKAGAFEFSNSFPLDTFSEEFPPEEIPEESPE